MNEFEQKLLRQSPRKIPDGWRAEILAATREAQAFSQPSSAVRRSLFSILNRQLSTFFWPHPKAWGALAAIWIFIFILNFSTRDKSPIMAEKSAPPSPEIIAQLRQQRLLFAQLMGSTEIHDAARQKIFSPRPRSKYAEILTA